MTQNTDMLKKIIKNKMIKIKNFVIIFVTLDIALISFSIYKGDNFLISSQSAFFASLLVTLASFFGYKKMVEKKIEIGDIPKEDRDDIEILEDKHDLYNKDRDLKEVIKEERAKITNLKSTAVNLGKSITGATSIFRILSYGVLFLSFLYLNNNNLLNIGAYLIGLAVVPIGVLLSIFLSLAK